MIYLHLLSLFHSVSSCYQHCLKRFKNPTLTNFNMPSMPFRKQQIQDSSHFDENMKKSDVACLMSNLVWPAWWDLMSNGHCRISSMTEKSHAWLIHHHSSNSSVWNEHQSTMDHEHQIVAKILRHSLVHLPNFHYYLHEIASTSIDGYRFKMFQSSIGVNISNTLDAIQVLFWKSKWWLPCTKSTN